MFALLRIGYSSGHTLYRKRIDIVAVCRFETSSYLREGRIVYRENPEESGFYEYHRWAAEPAETITAAMIDALRSLRFFPS